jgi:hypothetical protein
VLAGLSGDVLEIGGGTRDGPALLRPGDHIADAYRGAASGAASPRARGREHCPSAKVLRAPAGDLPFDDHTSTWPCPRWCCAGSTTSRGHGGELRRVLRPGGQLLFIEHVCALAARLGAVR